MRWSALLPLLVLFAPAAAHADEIRCLTGGSQGQIHLSWKLPAEDNAPASCGMPARPPGCA